MKIADDVKNKILARKDSQDPDATYKKLGLGQWYVLTTTETSADVAQMVQQLKSDKSNVETASVNGLAKLDATRTTSPGAGSETTGGENSTTTTGCSDPNDPYSCTTGSWGQSYADQWSLDAGNVKAAWKLTKGSSNVIIAIPDSGVDYAQDDIKNNIWLNKGEDKNGNGCADYWGAQYSTRPDAPPAYRLDCHGNPNWGDLDGIDNESNGYTDDLNGMDLVQNNQTMYDTTLYTVNDVDGPADFVTDHCAIDTNKTCQFDANCKTSALPQDVCLFAGNGHGSHVAGIAGASVNNAASIAGVCGDCKIMPIRNSYSYLGYGSDEQRAASVLYAANNGADVINMSWGTSGDDVMRNAIYYANSVGAVLITAAGNAGTGPKVSIDDNYPQTIQM